MVNKTGRNGVDNGIPPPEKELIAALQQYAREGLSMQRRIVRLREDFGYKIGTTKFKALQNKYNIARVRKPPPLPVATTLACEKIAEDPYHCKEPNAIKAMLAAEGYQIPRSVVRFVMHDNDPVGFVLRNTQSGCRRPPEELTSPGSHISKESCQSDKTDTTSTAQGTDPENHPPLTH